MIQWLKRVIGTVQNLIKDVMLVTPEMGIQIGGDSNGVTDTPPVKQSRKRKPSVARSIKQEPSLKPVKKTAKATTQRGKRQATPASKTPRLVVNYKSQKPKAAVSTTQGKKRTQGKTPAQTRTASQSKVSGH